MHDHHNCGHHDHSHPPAHTSHAHGDPPPDVGATPPPNPRQPSSIQGEGEQVGCSHQGEKAVGGQDGHTHAHSPANGHGACGHGGGGHHHHHHRGTPASRLAWVFGLTFSYMIIQLTGSFLTDSLALLADSGHMLGDSVSIGVALLAMYVARLGAPPHHTFGFARFEILTAMFNGLLLAGVAVVIFSEAFERFFAPEPVQSGLMLMFATVGLGINLFSAWLLHKDQHGNLNIRGAYLHVLSDLMGSVGAMLAGALILFFGWLWADAAISCVIALLVLFSAIRLIRDAAIILLEGTPRHIQLPAIRSDLLRFPGVRDVHNLHVWCIDSEKIVLTAHLIVDQSAYTPETLSTVQRTLQQKYHLNHATLQMEVEG